MHNFQLSNNHAHALANVFSTITVKFPTNIQQKEGDKNYQNDLEVLEYHQNLPSEPVSD